MSVEELKEKIITRINTLSKEELSEVEAFLNDLNNNSIDLIYSRAVDRYNETLQKLAQ